MKNKYQIIIIVFLLGVFFSSCEDILTENPKSFLTPANFPANEKDAIAATNAVYSRLFSDPRELYDGFITTDIAFQGWHNKRPIAYFVNLDEFNDDSNGLWKTAYEGISRTNTVINYVPDVKMDAVLRDRLVGEGKFLRAFYYFGLVQKYGGVPIIDHVLSGPDELVGITRATVADVYTLIEKDLLEAIPVLPESYSSDELGRPTSYSAMTLLAKVYLTVKAWDKAIQYSQQVINSGKYGLVADYNKLFHRENEHKLFPGMNGGLVNENIWDVQFAVNDRGSTITSQTGSRDKFIGGPTNVYGGYENMLPTPEWRAMFENGDKRLSISYITEVSGHVLKSPATTGAGPICGKYHDPDNEPPLTQNSGNNIYVLRYADVLLMRAEAENELNGPGGAYEFINQVRKRAGVPDLTGLSKDEFRMAIQKERATELGFEGHRKYDLLRWGIYVQTVRNTTNPFMQIPRDNIKDYHVLLPIPSNEIAASNGSINQNPGY